jgi:hypothetical protein
VKSELGVRAERLADLAASRLSGWGDSQHVFGSPGFSDLYVQPMALSGLVLNGLASFMRCGIFCELLLLVEQRKALLVFRFHQLAAACVFHVVLQIYRSPLNLQSRGEAPCFSSVTEA